MRRALTFVTGNTGKLQEVKAILPDFEIIHADADLPEYQGSPVEIATKKCLDAAEKFDGPVLIEDTSLCFEALGGLPGPYIKWFLKELGPNGLPKLLAGFDNKAAYAMCVFAYIDNKNKEPKIFEGITRGTIVTEPRGERFGWDPIFQPEGFDKTFAEMDYSIKNSISHRSKALSLVKEFLTEE